MKVWLPIQRIFRPLWRGHSYLCVPGRDSPVAREVGDDSHRQYDGGFLHQPRGHSKILMDLTFGLCGLAFKLDCHLPCSSHLLAGSTGQQTFCLYHQIVSAEWTLNPQVVNQLCGKCGDVPILT